MKRFLFNNVLQTQDKIPKTTDSCEYNHTHSINDLEALCAELPEIEKISELPELLELDFSFKSQGNAVTSAEQLPVATNLTIPQESGHEKNASSVAEARTTSGSVLSAGTTANPSEYRKRKRQTQGHQSKTKLQIVSHSYSQPILEQPTTTNYHHRLVIDSIEDKLPNRSAQTVSVQPIKNQTPFLLAEQPFLVPTFLTPQGSPVLFRPMLPPLTYDMP